MSSSDSGPGTGLQDKEFSLAPSIFLPFTSFPPGPSPISNTLEPPEKLKKIIENINSQQERVRGNMMFLVQQRAQRLTSKAAEAVATAESEDEDEDENSNSRDKSERREKDRKKEERQRSVDACFAAMRVPAKQGARSEDYEVKNNNTASIGKSRATTSAQGNQDVEMTGMEKTSRSPLKGNVNNSLTKTQILTTLSHDLKTIVACGTAQMQGYDIHAKQIIQPYQQSLDRRTARRGSTQGAGSMGSPANTLGSGGVASPVDLHLQGFRRMSTGMPMVGMGSSVGGGQQPARVPETIGELARRGSK